jgi:hypothetical protein
MCNLPDESQVKLGACSTAFSLFCGRAFRGGRCRRRAISLPGIRVVADSSSGNEPVFWQRLFETLLAELQKQHQIDWYRALVDSSSLRAPCGGAKTGPNPTDRRKLGSKHHLLTDGRGIPLAIILTEANRHDVTQLLPLLDKVPRVKGQTGAPRCRPKHVQGDRAYDSQPHRREIKKRG